MKKHKITTTLCAGEDKSTSSANFVDKSVWTADRQTVNSCELCDQRPPVVEITPSLLVKTETLLGKYPHKEWIAYLVGNQNDNLYRLTDLRIPKQEQSSATSDIDEADQTDQADVIGTIHSHHTMGAFFSGTDDKYLVPNHPVAIIVANSGWACKVRRELPCGHYLAMKAKLQTASVVNVDIDSLIHTADEKISEKTYAYQSSNQTYGNAYYCALCGKFDLHTRYHLTEWFCPEHYEMVDGLAFKEQAEFIRIYKDEFAKTTEAGATQQRLLKEGQSKVNCDVCHRFVAEEEMDYYDGKAICDACWDKLYEQGEKLPLQGDYLPDGYLYYAN